MYDKVDLAYNSGSSIVIYETPLGSPTVSDDYGDEDIPVSK